MLPKVLLWLIDGFSMQQDSGMQSSDHISIGIRRLALKEKVRSESIRTDLTSNSVQAEIPRQRHGNAPN